MTIDWWTLGFQSVNVAVLVWLLQHFFWRPVAAMIALRRTHGRTGPGGRKGPRGAGPGRRGTGRHRTDAGRFRPRSATRSWPQPMRRRTKRPQGDARRAQRNRRHQTAAASAQAWPRTGPHGRPGGVVRPGRRPGRARSPGVWPHGCEGPAISAAFLDWLLVEHPGRCPAPPGRPPRQDGAIVEAVSAQPLPPAEQDRYARAHRQTRSAPTRTSNSKPTRP